VPESPTNESHAWPSGVPRRPLSLGVSPDFFDRHLRSELRLVRRGRLVFVAVSELERWLDSNAARSLEGM
jgi:hypothetical protein